MFGGKGSSPRLRGTLRDGFAVLAHLGIIPALAGNTVAGISRLRGRWDHPRACGEHDDMRPIQILELGSSPRLRGTLSEHARPRRGLGIIPALAGNTARARTVPTCLRDHPRACGEHTRLTVPAGTYRGSSPRLRGTRRPACFQAFPPGIIPALAGNT